MNTDISRFQNENDQIIAWPKKHADKQLVLEFLLTKFDISTTYNEQEVNEIIKSWHTFNDWPLLRRSLIDKVFLTRDINGYAYRRVK